MDGFMHATGDKTAKQEQPHEGDAFHIDETGLTLGPLPTTCHFIPLELERHSANRHAVGDPSFLSWGRQPYPLLDKQPTAHLHPIRAK